MTPKELALRYFETVKTRDVERFAALFIEGASMIYPDGREAKGRAAIREHQATVYASATPPTPYPQSMIEGEASVAVELEAHLGDGRVFNMANCFYFNAEGLIERLRVYRRG